MRALSFWPRQEQYASIFAEQAKHIAEAADALVEMFDAPSDDYAKHAAGIKEIEHACDELTHRIVTKLNESFITPFDRDDIYNLSVALDDIVDLIDDVANAMVIYDVHEPTAPARHFGNVLRRMAFEIREVISTLEHRHDITRGLIEIHRLENEGDEIYQSAVRDLFRHQSNPLVIIKWKAIYEELESAVDRCERVATIVERILIKST